MIRNPDSMKVSRPRSTPLPTYSDGDYEIIAKAIGDDFDVSCLFVHRHAFEAEARWFELDTASPKRIAPSITKKKLNQISAAARKLLLHLNIRNSAEASDGPDDITILCALASIDGKSVDSVTRAAERVGRLVERVEEVEAARELERMAEEAAEDVASLGELIVPKKNQGDAAVNNWIASMLSIYVKVTGDNPTTSVGAEGQPDEGIAGGRLIRFLEASGAPLGIEYGSDAWRSRVRTILDSSPRQN